jgi:hypothetical protein
MRQAARRDLHSARVTFPHAGPDESPRRDYRVVFIPDCL